MPDDFFIFDTDEQDAAERVNAEQMGFVEYDFDIAGGEPEVIAFAVFGVVDAGLLHNGVKFGIEAPKFGFGFAPILAEIVNRPFGGALIADDDVGNFC